MTLPLVPDFLGFPRWKVTVNCEVSAASGRGSGATFAWLAEVDAPGATYEGLAASPKSFESLDCKLATALLKCVSGELAMKVYNAIDRANRHGRMATGRQLLWIIRRNFDANLIRP